MFLKKKEKSKEVILCFALFYSVSLYEPCCGLADQWFWPGNGREQLKPAHIMTARTEIDDAAKTKQRRHTSRLGTLIWPILVYVVFGPLGHARPWPPLNSPFNRLPTDCGPVNRNSHQPTIIQNQRGRGMATKDGRSWVRKSQLWRQRTGGPEL